MAEKELALCDECGSLFFKGSSQMMGLCPECAHVLYGYPNCDHHFQNGRCVNCYWDGSKSVYIKKQNQQEETDMPTTEWLNKYEAIKDKLTCKDDLEAHFTEKVIGNMAVDVLDIGVVHFPTGTIFACDPLVELEDTDELRARFDDLLKEHRGQVTESSLTRQDGCLRMEITVRLEPPITHDEALAFIKANSGVRRVSV